MDDSWISLPDAIERIRSNGDLSFAKACIRAVEAFAAGEVRTRWESYEGQRGEARGTRPAIARHAWIDAAIPEPDLMVSSDGTERRGIAVNEADLQFLMQAHVPKNLPHELSENRLTAREHAQRLIPELCAQGLTRAEVYAEVKRVVRDVQTNELDEAWDKVAPSSSRRPGRRSRGNPLG